MYSAVVSQEVFQGRLEPWRWGKQWLPSEVDDDQLRGSDPLTTTQEVAQELSVYHSIVVWHLKQTGKVKKLDKWMPHELTAKKKKIYVLKCHLLIYATTSYFSIGLWYAMKSGFYTTTSDDQLSVWAESKLQSTSQSQTCTKKVIVTVWCPTASLIHYSLLNPSETATFEKYAIKTVTALAIKVNRLFSFFFAWGLPHGWSCRQTQNCRLLDLWFHLWY